MPEVEIIFLYIGIVCVFLLPTFIAFGRSHKNAIPILLTNILLGWTGIVWILCLIWSFTSNVKSYN